MRRIERPVRKNLTLRQDVHDMVQSLTLGPGRPAYNVVVESCIERALAQHKKEGAAEQILTQGRRVADLLERLRAFHDYALWERLLMENDGDEDRAAEAYDRWINEMERRAAT